MRRSANLNFTFVLDTVMFLMSIMCKDCIRCPVRRAVSVTTFQVSCDKLSVLYGDSLFRYLRTIFVSHTTVAFGRAGLDTKIPFINLVITGCCPTLKLSMVKKVDKADLAVPRAEYPRPWS